MIPMFTHFNYLKEGLLFTTKGEHNYEEKKRVIVNFGINPLKREFQISLSRIQVLKITGT
jgi:hypothetical protein